MTSIRIIGQGRAGASFGEALRKVGHTVDGPLGRTDPIARAAAGVDALILAVGDDAISTVAAAVAPDARCAVIHLSGSLGCDVLVPHPRRAAMHPLVPLPNPEVGAARLLDRVTMAVAGDSVAAEIADSLGARIVTVDDTARAAYHAAACIASNHVVALLGQVERIAATVGLDLDTFLGLARAAVDDVDVLGPRAALTGPASRGDFATIARHLDAMDETERVAYGAGVAACLELSGTGVALPAALVPHPDHEHATAARSR